MQKLGWRLRTFISGNICFAFWVLCGSSCCFVTRCATVLISCCFITDFFYCNANQLLLNHLAIRISGSSAIGNAVFCRNLDQLLLQHLECHLLPQSGLSILLHQQECHLQPQLAAATPARVPSSPQSGLASVPHRLCHLLPQSGQLLLHLRACHLENRSWSFQQREQYLGFRPGSIPCLSYLCCKCQVKWIQGKLEIDVIYLYTRRTATYCQYKLTHMLATAYYVIMGKNPESHDTAPLRLQKTSMETTSHHIRN